ncbi:DSBA thioredoxin domain protein [Bifidobacterium gallicum DSM 20093 = LMG 11596]|nr:DSBA thioredoxin domain protein [Bifidobacterium gallicum DSM 20093 = LMG 11596]
MRTLKTIASSLLTATLLAVAAPAAQAHTVTESDETQAAQSAPCALWHATTGMEHHKN